MKTAAQDQKQVKADVLDEFDRAILDWRPRGPARGLAEVYHEDRKALRRVFRAIRDDKLDEAATLVRELDTIVRDYIPENVWNYLNV